MGLGVVWAMRVLWPGPSWGGSSQAGLAPRGRRAESAGVSGLRWDLGGPEAPRLGTAGGPPLGPHAAWEAHVAPRPRPRPGGPSGPFPTPEQGPGASSRIPLGWDPLCLRQSPVWPGQAALSAEPPPGPNLTSDLGVHSTARQAPACLPAWRPRCLGLCAEPGFGGASRTHRCEWGLTSRGNSTVGRGLQRTQLWMPSSGPSVHLPAGAGQLCSGGSPPRHDRRALLPRTARSGSWRGGGCMC